MDDEFYVGYDDRMPPRLARSMRRFVVGLLVGVTAVGALVASGFDRLPDSRFEYGHQRRWTGELRARPYPQLVGAREEGGRDAPADYLLVAPGKFGADELVAGHDGRPVLLEGTLVTRDSRAAIQVEPGTLHDMPFDSSGRASPSSLGRVTVRGEIVDTKCYLGVMNPGERKVHRDCAIRCISGGIPPALVVHDAERGNDVLLLVDAEGRPLGARVAGLAGLPVEVTGEVVQDGRSRLLRADLSAYRRLDR